MLELLRVKLVPPCLPSDLIPRPRLVERLHAALECPLTLVSAPAGFGKTTLLGEWQAAVPLEIAWLSLDENDNDPTTFVTYLLGAIQSVFPNACRTTQGLVRSPRLPALKYLAQQLANDIAALPADFVLILDDYHLLTQSPTHELMDALLRHMPPPLHLVVATRVDPVLPLTRLRADGKMLELRASDLRFSLDEATEFLTQSIPTALAPDMLASIQTRMEGWPAGTRLALISLRAQIDPTQHEQVFREHGEQLAMNYLLEEVLTRQPPEIQTFLLRTSLFERFTPELCDAVNAAEAPGSSRGVIEQLKRANLFLVTLDETNEWYRYHQLFRDLIAQKRRELDADAGRGVAVGAGNCHQHRAARLRDDGDGKATGHVERKAQNAFVSVLGMCDGWSAVRIFVAAQSIRIGARDLDRDGIGLLITTITQSMIPEANREGEPSFAGVLYVGGIAVYALLKLSGQ